MKQAFISFCAIILLTLVAGAFCSALAQTPSATPVPFVSQLTTSPAGFNSFAGDLSANGRIVVFESTGDVSTEKIPTRNADGTINPAARNNEDGNREIFLIDYAQRRIFQITNTRNVPKATPTPTPTPTPSPSPAATPTPTPVATPPDPTTIQIEVSNNRPTLTLVPGTNGHYRIVFSSNAPNPSFFNGVDTGGALALDANQEVWIYEVPIVTDVDLTTGNDLGPQDLASGTFTQITNTPASRVPSPGATGFAPFVADDNREATISETGDLIAFISTRNLAATPGNADGNPELFLTSVGSPGTFLQITNTRDRFVGPTLFSEFQSNPSMSANGSVIAFISNANLPIAGASGGANNDDGNGHGNAEIYVFDFNGSSASNFRQATRTKSNTSGVNLGATVNVFSPGRRLSRDGTMLAFESLADDPKADTTATNQPFLAVFVYNIGLNKFDIVGKRAVGFPGDVIHFPTFTDYNASLAPSTVIYASALNFKVDGTFPAAGQESTGLNPSTLTQVFATQVPLTTTNTFTRLTQSPAFVGIKPFASETRQRIVFSVGGAEFGGGNPDGSTEVFYMLSPPVAVEPTAVLSFFTGMSNIPVPAASPTPSPTPAPTPTPTPGTVTGLAAGELAIVRSTVDFVGSDSPTAAGSETKRSPALPIELNGVSVSVNGAAAGLYFVGQASRQINFVVPIGLAPGLGTVVINSRLNGGTQLRGFVRIVPAQPDIFTTTNDAGGRAGVVNVTNPMTRTPEPFTVTSTDGSGNVVPTVLEVTLTGVRNVTAAEVKVTIVKGTESTDITGASIVLVRSNPQMPGFDIIDFTLPATLAAAGDVPIIVTITRNGVTYVSRPAATAPHITIN